MTDNSNFKKKVRERMARTGESYTTARMRLLEDGSQTVHMQETEAGKDLHGEFDKSK